MKRTKTTTLSLALVAALGACGSPGISEQTTTPPASPSPAPETTVVATPEPAPAPKPPEPPAPTYHHGKWVWFELNTSDAEAATKFYTELLGWKVEPKDMNGMKYNAIMNGEKELGMLIPFSDEAKQKKMAPAWLGYVSVPSVDASVTAATGAGATVPMPATDMAGVGRFAVVTDPWGASFGVMTSSQGDGVDQAPGAGDFIWIEHLTKDAKKAAEAQAFYGSVAGFENKTLKVGKVDYAIGTKDGIDRVGFMKADKPTLAGKFVMYFVVADVDATVKNASTLKGKVLVKAKDLPGVGRLAVLSDPQGAVFAVMTPAPTPTEGSAAATP